MRPSGSHARPDLLSLRRCGAIIWPQRRLQAPALDGLAHCKLSQADTPKRRAKRKQQANGLSYILKNSSAMRLACLTPARPGQEGPLQILGVNSAGLSAAGSPAA